MAKPVRVIADGVWIATKSVTPDSNPAVVKAAMRGAARLLVNAVLAQRYREAHDPIEEEKLDLRADEPVFADAAGRLFGIENRPYQFGTKGRVNDEWLVVEFIPRPRGGYRTRKIPGRLYFGVGRRLDAFKILLQEAEKERMARPPEDICRKEMMPLHSTNLSFTMLSNSILHPNIPP